MQGRHRGSVWYTIEQRKGISSSHLSNESNLYRGVYAHSASDGPVRAFLLEQAFCFYDQKTGFHGKIKNTEYSFRREVMRVGSGGSYGITK